MCETGPDLRRGEEDGGLAEVAHGVELGPGDEGLEGDPAHLSNASWNIFSIRLFPLRVVRRLAALRSSSLSFLSAPLSQKILTWQ